MPANSVLGIHEAISEALRGSIKETSLEERLVAASKKVLLTSIDFEKAGEQFSHLQHLRMKYKPLNAGSSGVRDVNAAKKEKMAGKEHGEEAPLKPRCTLYAAEKLRMTWTHVLRVGAGLENAGNTCFLNAVLQCLTYTPPLTHYLLSGEHGQQCHVVGFCVLCDLQNHMKRALSHSGHVIRPQMIIARLRQIAKHFRFGRQEDAHEFLRYVLDVAQKNCLAGQPRDLDRFSRETTVINQIFGGYHRSQVQCLKCRAKSNTYDHFLDISLDIKVANSVQRALERFVQPELLQKENAYDCRHCACKVTAQKRFTVFHAPSVLTLQLKRFEYARFDGRKVHDMVHYPEQLDLRPYMSRRDGPPVLYSLYGIVCHSGGGIHSGHYYAYAKAPNGVWHVFNDTIVRDMKNTNVLNRPEAYLLFYVRDSAQPRLNGEISHSGAADAAQKPGAEARPDAKAVAAPPASPAKGSFIGPRLPQGLTINEAAKRARVDMGSPVPRQALSPPAQQKVPPKSAPENSPKPKVTPSSSPLAREKISFGIKPHTELVKPRIVMHIKQGKVVANTSKADPADAAAAKLNPLVPYPEQSSSDNDSDAENKEAVKRKPREAAASPKAGKTDKLPSGLREGNRPYPDLQLAVKSPLGAKQSGNVPAARSVSSPITVQHVALCSPLRNGTPPVRATSQWIVTDHNLVSPSSQGSNWSVNSTTEWTVSDGSPRKAAAASREYSLSAGWTIEADTKPAPAAPQPPAAGAPPDEEKNEEQEQSRGACDASSSAGGSERLSSGHASDSDSRQSSIRLKLCKRNSSSEKPTETQSSESDDTRHRKKKRRNGDDAEAGGKKHKKRKRQRSRSPGEEGGECASESRADDDEASVRKRHKKHKKKRRKEKERRKREARSEDDDDDGEASFKMEWVEKTKETVLTDTLDALPAAAAATELKPDAQVPTYSWDAHAKEGVAAAAVGSGAPARPSLGVEELLLGQSSHGYGVGVSSWDGGDSHVDLDVKREIAEQQLRRRYDDGHDEELDCGKTKKVKQRPLLEQRPASENPFQKVATLKQQVGSHHWQTPSGSRNHYQVGTGCHGNSHRGDGYHAAKFQGGGPRTGHGDGYSNYNYGRNTNTNGFQGNSYHSRHHHHHGRSFRN
ncbi:PREDICTED: ubiquitin carboxyl-terminal hydrolase 36-like [Priapulus caudatus]|uniref:Ubiquitin carboxyl-terminal hydrolase 36 n=1 Tax=Priapulus caudatus TaxID=37621 RepID=A0ABM1ELF7_PRICU|nr:PREDICTED: ubiquitin carboxyl-terminal hydrolase 36-like [Priapulus caudatus]